MLALDRVFAPRDGRVAWTAAIDFPAPARFEPRDGRLLGVEETGLVLPGAEGGRLGAAGAPDLVTGRRLSPHERGVGIEASFVGRTRMVGDRRGRDEGRP